MAIMSANIGITSISLPLPALPDRYLAVLQLIVECGQAFDVYKGFEV